MMDRLLVSISEALKEIPVNAGPDGIARFLRAHGCTGWRGSNVRCPLTAYVARRTGFAPDNFVATHRSVHFVFWEDPNRYPQEIHPLPNIIGRFLRNFDEFNAYPELVAAQ